MIIAIGRGQNIQELRHAVSRQVHVCSDIFRSRRSADREYSQGAALEDARIVPQLELTDLHPVKVAFAPDDGKLLMVVNDHGRIDLFDISSPSRSVKITEIAAAAKDAVFSPKGYTARQDPHRLRRPGRHSAALGA